MAFAHADVLAARERIAPHVHRTPVLTCAALDAQAGRRLFFKCENLQKVGAFKYRGAMNAVLQLTPEQRARGVVTHSSGNHAQALALAGKQCDLKTYIVIPSDAPAPKINAVRGYGADVIHSGRTTQSREEVCARVMEETGATFIAPYNNLGTLALELLEDVPDLDVIISPVSGGGLLSGICVAAKGLRPSIRIFGAEPSGANDAQLSLRRGEPVSMPENNTVCDGLRSAQLGSLTWPVIKEHVTDILTVDDDAVKAAMFLLWERMKLVVEPSGAIGLAVALSDAFRSVPNAHKVGIVLSGGNVDIKQWACVTQANPAARHLHMEGAVALGTVIQALLCRQASDNLEHRRLRLELQAVQKRLEQVKRMADVEALQQENYILHHKR